MCVNQTVIKNLSLSNASSSWLKSLALPWHWGYKYITGKAANIISFPKILTISFQ